MMQWLIETDKDLFFLLNSWHTTWLDPVMYYASETLTWLPVYLGAGYLLFREYGWKSLLWLVAIAVAVTLSDQLTSEFMKPFFARFRPSRDPAYPEGLVHIVYGYRGGQFGFASSHAANGFAVATLLVLALRHRFAWIYWMYAVAGFIAYTRIYLGVHYPGDIIAGALIGTFFGWICYKLMLLVLSRLPLRT